MHASTPRSLVTVGRLLIAWGMILGMAGSADAQRPWHSYKNGDLDWEPRTFSFGFSNGPVWYGGSLNGYGYAPPPYWVYPPYTPPGAIVGQPGWVSGYGPVYGYPAFLPPVIIPAEELYGPRAVQRFMGVNTPTQPFPTTNVSLPVSQPAAGGAGAPAGNGGFGVLAPANPAPPAANKPRLSNDAARGRAADLMRTGDEHFRQQRFAQAMSRYRDASSNAPDVAECYFRTGWAHLAMNQDALAVKAFRRGLEMQPDWPRSGFKLSDLFGEPGVPEQALVESLQKRIDSLPFHPDARFLLGVVETFRNRPVEAREHLMRARALALGDDSHILRFLDAQPLILNPPPMP